MADCSAAETRSHIQPCLHISEESGQGTLDTGYRVPLRYEYTVLPPILEHALIWEFWQEGQGCLRPNARNGIA